MAISRNNQNNIMRKLDQHVVSDDFERLWNVLEPRLEKKKRRPILLYFWLGFLGLAMPFCIFLVSNDPILKNVVATSHPNKATSPKSPINASDSVLKIQGSSIQQNSSQIPANHFGQNSQKSPTFKKINSTNVQYGFNGELSASNVPKWPQFAAGQIKNTSSAKEVNNDNYTIENDFELRNDIHSSRKKIGKLYSNSMPILQNLFRGFTFLAATKTTFPLPNIHVFQKRILIKNKWIFTLAGLTNYSNLTSFDSNMRLRDAIAPSIGYGIETSARFLLSQKWSVYGGLNLISYREKFEYKNIVTVTDNFENPEAFKVSERFIGAIQNYSKTIKYDVLNYNKQNLLSFKLGIHYKFTRQLYSELSIHTVISQKYSGRLLDDKLIVKNSGDIFEQTKLSSFYPSLRIGYQFYEKQSVLPSIFVGFSRQQYFSSGLSPLSGTSRHSAEFGIRYQFNPKSAL